MSDDPKPLDLSDLSGLSLAPAWVSELDKPASQPAKEYTEYEERPGRGGPGGRGKGGGGGRGRRDDRRDGGGAGAGRGRRDDNRGRGDGQRRDDRRGGGGGPGRGGQDRRDGRGRDNRRDGGGGRGRDRDSRFGDRPPRQDERPPEGISVDVQPVPSGLESLASWIRSTGRATSVYELAKAMLRRRELYQLHFKRTAENAPKLICCKADGTLWTSREAAVGHWIQAGAPGDFYAEEEVEVDPPKGNFTAIAICGMSGTMLGPPNHHTYQTNLHRLHRERFSNIPIDRYKSRVNVEHGEEIVEKWRAQNSHTTQYRWLKDPSLTAPESSDGLEPAAPEDQAEPTESQELEENADSSPLSQDPDAPVEPTDPAAPPEPEAEPEASGPEPEPENSETPTDETADSDSEADSEAEPDSPETISEPSEPKPAGLTLQSIDELRRHALTHHADDLFVEVESAVVNGNISGKDLGGPLLSALKAALEPLRKSPASLVPGLCKELEHRGLKIFRWGRALFANSTRPRPLAEDANLSDRISKIISLVREHPGIGTKRILRTLLEKPAETPAEVQAETPALECGGSTPLSPAPTTPVAETAPSPIPNPEPEPPSPKQPADAPTADAPTADAPPADAPPATAPAQTPEQHAAEVAILRDLRWLVHEGYLIEFTEGKIFLATARPPAHPAKKKQAPKRKRARKPRQNPADRTPKPKPEDGAPKPATELADNSKPGVSPDAPTEKIIRDTDAPKEETERVPIPNQPPSSDAPSEPQPDPPAPDPAPSDPIPEAAPSSDPGPGPERTTDQPPTPEPDPKSDSDPTHS